MTRSDVTSTGIGAAVVSITIVGVDWLLPEIAGAEARFSFVMLNAALKRRSSTVAQAFVSAPETRFLRVRR
jgi:hypothetical protein